MALLALAKLGASISEREMSECESLTEGSVDDAEGTKRLFGVPSELDSLFSSGRSYSWGTCFAVSPDGHLATNADVVGDSTDITATFLHNHRAVRATVLARDKDSGAVILKVGLKTPSYLPLASSAGANLRQRVFTIGFPAPQELGLYEEHVRGTISAVVGDDKLQIHLPLRPGNSGGPLLAEDGRVLGITALAFDDRNSQKRTGTLRPTINLAIRSERASALMPKAVTQETRRTTRKTAVEKATRSLCIVVARH
jgi:S1-C subfamily serine protease